ncbi:MAG TPA: GNAT family N-acetyltransferase [Chitinophagales bacterium]|nr:GNAT family N-acetyltransferase [Chitinophagales bacterium]
MYQFERVKTDSAANSAHAKLLADVFGKPELFTEKFIDWQYAQNPSGKIVGFNAMAGDTIAGHYVTQPLVANFNGNFTKGLLSLNTATHNDHRGKGLFTQLAEKSYDAAAAEGYGFVIGVANQNSVHGFLNKLGFASLGLLKAKIGLGNVPATTGSVGYERLWSETDLKWRLANPCNQYYKAEGSGVTYFSKTHIGLIKANLINLPKGNHPDKPSVPFAPLTLYIGLDPALNLGKHLFVDIPERYKSSPLHLIFKDLTGKNQKPDPQNMRFRLLDFDAY